MKFKNDKEKAGRLANLMNEQSETPAFVTDELLHIFDAVLEPEDVDLLLELGGGKLVLSEIESRVVSAGDGVTEIFDHLLDIGIIIELEPEGGERIYHLNSIFPGWFEAYLMGGKETPDRRLFAQRVKALYESSLEMGNPELINEVMRAAGPHRSIAVTTPSGGNVISVGQSLEPPVGEVFPSHSVLEVLNRVGEDDVITAGHCFCRQQKKMVGDPCRMDLPDESCIALGPAAEHLFEKNFARRITKDEAVRIIERAADKGAVHQIGRVLPLKDFKPRFEVDIICNCCWDCCGAIGNHSRGYLPFILKSYYMAEIPDADTCTGCGVCEDFCPVRAISLDASGVAEIDRDMCCGCGQCALHCPEDAVRLDPSEREVFIPILPRGDNRI
jgi:ferredoxin